VREWGGVLPTQSISLRLPVFSPSEQNAAMEHARHENDRPPSPGDAIDTSNTDGGRAN